MTNGLGLTVCFDTRLLALSTGGAESERDWLTEKALG